MRRVDLPTIWRNPAKSAEVIVGMAVAGVATTFAIGDTRVLKQEINITLLIVFVFGYGSFPSFLNLHI